MEVILREDYLALGYIGDTVKVKRGYARNYLIPRGIAVESSSRNERMLQHKLGAILSMRKKKKGEAEQFGTIIQQITVEFSLKIGAQGKSFGSITAKDIETSLKSLGYEVDRRQIKIGEPIRTVGAHTVEVKLHSEVSVPLQIKVMAAAKTVAEEASDEAESKRTRRGRSKKDDVESVETPADDEQSSSSEE